MYLRVTFLLDESQEDTVAAWLDDLGGLGAEWAPTPGGKALVQAYFPRNLGREALALELERLSGAIGVDLDARLDEVSDEGWVEAYQRRLVPFDVGRRLRVVPGGTVERTTTT